MFLCYLGLHRRRPVTRHSFGPRVAIERCTRCGLGTAVVELTLDTEETTR